MWFASSDLQEALTDNDATTKKKSKEITFITLSSG